MMFNLRMGRKSSKNDANKGSSASKNALQFFENWQKRIFKIFIKVADNWKSMGEVIENEIDTLGFSMNVKYLLTI